jgi:hypothetical protein
MKKAIKKYQPGGTTTRKNLLGRTIVESVNTSAAPSFSEGNKIATTNRTRQVYRKDGSLLKDKRESEANKPRSYDLTTTKVKYDKQGNVKKTKVSEAKGISYAKKGGSVKSKTTKKK